MKMKKGFTLIEVLIVIGLISIMTLIFLRLQSSESKLTKRQQNDIQIQQIKNVIKSIYYHNLEYITQNCLGYSDSKCENITLLPHPDENDNTKLIFGTDNSSLLAPLKNFNCLYKEKGTNEYVLTCYDYFGKKLTFDGINLPKPNTKYLDPYKGKMPEISIKNKFKTYKLDFTDVIQYSIAKTMQKEVDIANAVKRFVRTLRLRELTNDCSDGGNSANPPNGLASWDDAMVPWIWRLVAQNTTQLCTGSSDGNSNTCGCTLFQNNSEYWETDKSFCIIHNEITWDRVLNNLGLGTNYRTDGFGNLFTISMLSDANGNPSFCPPPAPHPQYYNIPQYPKLRLGLTDNCNVVDGSFDQTCSWYSFVDIYGE